MDKIITVPFGYLLDYLYRFTDNYGVALILFAILVQIVLLPITIKSKKSMMKMTRLQPKMQAIKDKYPDDQKKQQEAMQALQKEEGVSMGCGGCLWSFVPLLILIPLYSVVRQPIEYIFHESADVAAKIVEVMKGANPDLFTTNAYYEQIVAISHNAGQRSAGKVHGGPCCRYSTHQHGTGQDQSGQSFLFHRCFLLCVVRELIDLFVAEIMLRHQYTE